MSRLLPGKPITDPAPGCTVVMIPVRQFHALPASVQVLFRAYRTSEYTDGRTVWLELPTYRVPELFAAAKKAGLMGA
jgi:hypothetical protein